MATGASAHSSLIYVNSRKQVLRNAKLQWIWLPGSTLSSTLFKSVGYISRYTLGGCIAPRAPENSVVHRAKQPPSEFTIPVESPKCSARGSGNMYKPPVERKVRMSQERGLRRCPLRYDFRKKRLIDASIAQSVQNLMGYITSGIDPVQGRESAI
jgi:hypothetical protein